MLSFEFPLNIKKNHSATQQQQQQQYSKPAEFCTIFVFFQILFKLMTLVNNQKHIQKELTETYRLGYHMLSQLFWFLKKLTLKKIVQNRAVFLILYQFNSALNSPEQSGFRPEQSGFRPEQSGFQYRIERIQSRIERFFQNRAE